MSQLRKCLAKENAVIDTHQPKIQPNLILLEKSKKITDRKDKVLRNKVVKLVKVFWNDQTEEATWEREDAVKQKHPELFDESGKFRERNFF